MNEWPRSRQMEMRLPLPLGFEVGFSLFRNPDAGVRLSVDVIRGRVTRALSWIEYTDLVRMGPGQCGERIWVQSGVWCYRPYGHSGDHALTVAEALA